MITNFTQQDNNQVCLNSQAVTDRKVEYDEQLDQISLKKPTKAYTFYLRAMKDQVKSILEKDEDVEEFEPSTGNASALTTNTSNISTINIHDLNNTQINRKKWQSMTQEEQKQYTEMEEEDKERYDEHLSWVKSQIVNKPMKESASAYVIYIDEIVKKAFYEEKDHREARKMAIESWKNMTESEQMLWDEKQKKHKELYEIMKKSKERITGYTLFVKDQLIQARNENKLLVLMDISNRWHKTNQNLKDKYAEYAEEVREEKERMRDLYEIAFGIKPRRPIGAYRCFMMEIAKDGKLEGKQAFKEAARLWAELGIEEKEKYRKIGKVRQLAYTIKKAEFTSIFRKTTGKAATPFNIFVNEIMKKDKDTEEMSRDDLFEYCHNKWNKVDIEVKLKYQKMAEEQKGEKEEEFQGKCLDPPKRPISAFNRFFKVRYEDLKERNPASDHAKITAMIGSEYKNINQNEKEKYDKEYQEDMNQYTKNLADFREKGFFTPNKSRRTTINRKSAEPSENAKKSKGSSIKIIK